MFISTAVVAQTPGEYKIVSGELYAFKLGNFIETQAGVTLSFSCVSGNKTLLGLHSKYVDFGPTGTPGKFEYTVDESRNKILPMVSASGIVHAADVKSLARDTVGGCLMLIEVSMPNGQFMHSKISLNGSDRSIKRVFADCG